MSTLLPGVLIQVLTCSGEIGVRVLPERPTVGSVASRCRMSSLLRPGTVRVISPV